MNRRPQSAASTRSRTPLYETPQSKARTSDARQEGTTTPTTVVTSLAPPAGTTVFPYPLWFILANAGKDGSKKSSTRSNAANFRATLHQHIALKSFPPSPTLGSAKGGGERRPQSAGGRQHPTDKLLHDWMRMSHTEAASVGSKYAMWVSKCRWQTHVERSVEVRALAKDLAGWDFFLSSPAAAAGPSMTARTPPTTTKNDDAGGEPSQSTGKGESDHSAPSGEVNTSSAPPREATPTTASEQHPQQQHASLPPSLGKPPRYYVPRELKGEPIVSFITAETLLRSRKVKASVNAWWKAMPKVAAPKEYQTLRQSMLAEEETERRRKLGLPSDDVEDLLTVGKSHWIHMHVGLHIALLHGDLALNLKTMKLLEETAAKDWDAMGAAHCYSIGETLFHASLLSLLEPWMETCNVDERVEALSLLFDQCFDSSSGDQEVDDQSPATFKLRTWSIVVNTPSESPPAGGGAERQQRSPSPHRTFRSPDLGISSNTDTATTNGATEVSATSTVGGVNFEAKNLDAVSPLRDNSREQSRKNLESLDHDLSRLVDDFDLSETGGHKYEGVTASPQELIQWRGKLRQLRKRKIAHQTASVALGGPNKRTRFVDPPKKADRYILERVLLDRMSTAILESKEVGTSPSLLNYANSQVIPDRGIKQVLKAHPGVVDRFRAVVESRSTFGGAEDGEAGIAFSVSGTGLNKSQQPQGFDFGGSITSATFERSELRTPSLTSPTSAHQAAFAAAKKKEKKKAPPPPTRKEARLQSAQQSLLQGTLASAPAVPSFQRACNRPTGAFRAKAFLRVRAAVGATPQNDSAFNTTAPAPTATLNISVSGPAEGVPSNSVVTAGGTTTTTTKNNNTDGGSSLPSNSGAHSIEPLRSQPIHNTWGVLSTRRPKSAQPRGPEFFRDRDQRFNKF